LSEFASRIFKEMALKFGVRSGPLFLIKGEIPTYRAIEHRYSRALKKAGLPFTATHILRHASLTEFYSCNKDLLATQRIAGHKKLETTAKYAKVRDETLISTQKEMDLKLSSFL
jgi:site-specific recombinase XerD